MLTTVNQFPVQETSLLIPGPAGQLELYIAPARIPTQGITAIICHPHPQKGGTMTNKVVTTLARSFRELGVNTVCFNFRGVGQSEGCFDQGMGESTDLLTVANWVQQQRPNDSLWLAGFSFGAFIALNTLPSLPAKLLVCIAPPVHYAEFLTIATPHCPWIVVQGEQDEVVNPAQVFAWLTPQTPAAKVIRMANAGHFFHGHLMPLKTELQATVSPFLAQGS